jgi:hypothetical protein
VGLTSEHKPLTATDARRELVRDIQEFLDSTRDQSIGLDRIAHEFIPVAKHVDANVSRREGESIMNYQARQRVRRASLRLKKPGIAAHK